jgi:beta-phosphoglucomutase-like phosphatase (HAD superfamily)
VIEDAPAGIEAAHNAGMRAIAIASTYPAHRLREADAIVEQLADLTIVYDGEQILINIDSRQAERRGIPT